MYVKKSKSKRKTYRRYGLVKKVNRISRQLRSNIKALVHTADTDLTDSGSQHRIDWSGRIDHLTAISSGSGQSNRTGFQMKAFYLMANLQVDVASSWQYPSNDLSVGRHAWYTCMVIQDRRQIADTHPSFDDILQDINEFAAPSGLPDSKFLGRFKVLYRKMLSFSPGGETSRFIRIRRKINVPVEYNGIGTTDIARNGIYMVQISSVNPAQGNGCLSAGRARIYFNP